MRGLPAAEYLLLAEVAPVAELREDEPSASRRLRGVSSYGATPSSALLSRESHYHRIAGAPAAPTIAASLLDLNISGVDSLREIIREVVREELRKILPAADRPSSLSLAEVVREEVHWAFQPELPINTTTTEEPTLSYAAVARRPPQAPRQARCHPEETPKRRGILVVKRNKPSVQLPLPHLLLEVRQQNRGILNELPQLKEVTKGHDDKLGLLEVPGARTAPAPEAVARPGALPRLPATTLEELMVAEEAVQDMAVAAASEHVCFTNVQPRGIFAATISAKINKDDKASQAIIGSRVVLVLAPGRAPLCLRCQRTGYNRKECRVPRCDSCRRYGHTKEDRRKTYAAVANGAEDDTMEHLMDQEEAEAAAAGDTENSQSPAQAASTQGSKAPSEVGSSLGTANVPGLVSCGPASRQALQVTEGEDERSRRNPEASEEDPPKDNEGDMEATSASAKRPLEAKTDGQTAGLQEMMQQRWQVATAKKGRLHADTRVPSDSHKTKDPQ
ncbi:hypothetical protein HPB47_019791 [Ixodes persulcatus]|uniref:Uncharacterized protein n=1 Tax=Ixodes persulcatus TaxID=34615 RepID=A0AC60QJ97_IXOPE|nr:hypothetical protein HPB47_019791 [Ixodes persulcatus]